MPKTSELATRQTALDFMARHCLQLPFADSVERFPPCPRGAPAVFCICRKRRPAGPSVKVPTSAAGAAAGSQRPAVAAGFRDVTLLRAASARAALPQLSGTQPHALQTGLGRRQCPQRDVMV